MQYFLNEYSLRGQFRNEEEFFDSLREYTLPVLKKIGENHENVIWKKQDLWQSVVCEGVLLQSIKPRRNERNVELTKLKQSLIRLYQAEPFWSPEGEKAFSCTYDFDVDYCQHFERINCFTQAIEQDGQIISFVHEAYRTDSLEIRIHTEKDTEELYELDNIYSSRFWEKEPQIKRWLIEKKYRVEVRAKEFTFHPPHFHVSYNEYAAVFRLRDGTLYRQGAKDMPPSMEKSIQIWFKENQDTLTEAWECLHGGI